MNNPIEELADAVGQRLTRDEIDGVCDLLDRAKDALLRLSEHAGDGKDDYRSDAEDLGDIVMWLHVGEHRYRGSEK